MGDWKTIKKGNKTSAHPTSLADTPTKQPLSSSASFGLLASDELKQRKQTSQVDQIPATAPPPGTARNPSPLPNSNTKTRIFPGSTITVLAELNGKESAQMKKSAPATKPTSNKSNGKPRKTKDRPRVPKKAGIMRLRTLLLALTAYAAYHWAYTCPSQGYPPRSSATNVCKALYHLEHGVWRPYGVPAVQYVSSTKPVREAQEHYDNVVRPYVDPLLLQTQQLHHKYGAPMLAQAKSVFVAYGEPVVAHTQTLYRQHVDPHVQKGYSAVKKEYDTYLGRRVDAAYATVDEFYKKHVAPHATPAAKAANGVFQDYLVPAYKRTVPMVHQAGAAAVTAYNEMIDPLARKSFAFAKGSYEKHVVPTVTKLWDEHGKPHYEAALSKLGFRVEPALKRSATTKATEGAKAMFEDVVEGIKVRATEAAQAVKDKGSKASEASERAAQAAKAKAAAAKKKADGLADQEATKAKAKAKANAAQEAGKVKAKEAQDAAKAKANAAQEAAKAKAKDAQDAAKAKAKEAQEAAKAKAQKAGEAVKAKAKEAQEATKAEAKSTGDTAKVKASQAQEAVKAKSAQGAKAASDTAQKVSDSVQNSLGEQVQRVMQMADDVEEAVHEKVKEAKTAAIPKAEEKVNKVKEKVASEGKTAAKEAKKKTNDAAESVKVGAEKVKGSVTGKVDAAKKVAGDAQRDAKAKIAAGNEAKIRHSEL